MTIDKAIKHCEEVADYNEKLCRYILGEQTEEKTKALEEWWTCASEHRQLAEWLRELKKYRAIFEKVGKILADNGYTIDDLDTIFGKVNEGVKADENTD